MFHVKQLQGVIMRYFYLHMIISCLLLDISSGLKSGNWLNVRDLEALQETIENVFNSNETVNVNSLLSEYKKFTRLKNMSVNDLYVYFHNLGVIFYTEDQNA